MLKNNSSAFYQYTLEDGTKMAKFQVINKIKAMFEDVHEFTFEEIRKECKLASSYVTHLIKFLIVKDFLTQPDSSKKVYRKIIDECLLENVLRPQNKALLEASKNHHGKKYRLDDQKNVSYTYPKSHYYGGLSKMSQTIYEGGE